MKNSKIQLIFKFYSFHPYVLNKTLQPIIRFLESFPFKFKNVSVLPIKKRSFTVLRSPHIDKKSREQFEMRIFKRSFSIFIEDLSHNKFLIEKIIRLIKMNSCGVQLLLTYRIKQ